MGLWRRHGSGPEPVRELLFAKSLGRRFRWDFAWPNPPTVGELTSGGVAVEVQGGIWTRGRHSRGGRAQIAESDKMNIAALLGWRVVFLTTAHLTENPLRSIRLVELVLNGETSLRELSLVLSPAPARRRSASRPRRRS